MYVWFEALTNYITAVGYGNEEAGGEKQFNKYWPADLHIVGKDILRFHAVYWPAFLMAGGLPLPKTVYAHGLLLSDGRKMSKTLGNVIDLHKLRENFTPDMVRYFCLREVVFGQDGDFTYEALIDRTNGDLAAGLGNLSSRILTMIRNYCDGVVPRAAARTNATLETRADEVRGAIDSARVDFDREFESFNFSRGLESVWSAITSVDKFISEFRPWDLAKDPERRADLEVVLETLLRAITVLLAPALPESCQEIRQQLGEKAMC
jgi:methionyl-tRNA synthetase